MTPLLKRMVGNHHTERRHQTSYLYRGVDALSPEPYLSVRFVPKSKIRKGSPTPRVIRAEHQRA